MCKKNILSNIKKKKINLLNFNLKKMINFFIKIGEKKFRAIQITDWIYKKQNIKFDQMSNLNFFLKKKLNNIAVIKIPKCIKKIKSIDGTIKWKFLCNKEFIETIYIPEKKRATLCISSQVGCQLKCNFCATGQLGYKRNLLVSEIIGQIWYVINKIKKYNSKKKNFPPIKNIVMMGMGEPLLNLKNIIIAIDIILGNYGFNFSKNKVTLSTSGIVPAINKIAGKIDISLAVSLHASNNTIRNKIMPINKIYNIQLLLESIKNYLKKSSANKGIVTIEYVMLSKINDFQHHAIELSNLLKNIPCKINLIPWNPIKNSSYICSSSKNIINFANFLRKKGFIVIIRKNRGSDIQAACGQLIA
ncbi:bifunctional tRNA (adenosine(37)-C2)-methyltransferase TrmG/ribosomal RNA large subunit methyltransferase RlmN [Buchnera aphidicola]|uniref:Dual-specificity RNA methyltransferase RlmN n=1 Tax=Buchnera aphidicola subsp. Cinara cedri (strain Cc) TaxID=372461 RepID=RLMN_BUCCC|nr:bifunctional tRNA (adenosine(37)-C2)-methyltransferase TrmG/ribosomal RNA large subunit methyltransferase RlmN [Buchnera aphidicola]Q057Q1.1 RecName: Full=Dual-specificity RNA methyltransferase RlmN; AltName: Full=23S rRNA (adenine(2503)-C(2))-methyltransferase; AltName: Full=23S rRNA m2A2503 methyltransferase; AltName: Full=Ribosomal RNA large subunit methyltransferase N; AltName: Full=tRNA (adenine(37)-C(2))-methyltransferase; AltName: Full=tRNA m2A37 methyltransferase [Buchnera aphidicola BC